MMYVIWDLYDNYRNNHNNNRVFITQSRGLALVKVARLVHHMPSSVDVYWLPIKTVFYRTVYILLTYTTRDTHNASANKSIGV